MRIAQVAPLYETVPPKLYGGTERVVAHLCDGLVELGHEVTLFAAAGARTKANLVPVREEPIRLDPTVLKSDLAAHLHLLEEVRARKLRFDILHFHLDMLHLPLFEDVSNRTITTLHGRLDLTDLQHVYKRWYSFPLVSISFAQRKPLAWAHWVANVPHGIPRDLYPLIARPQGGYLAFLGRIAPEKRPERAIQLAARARVPLKIAAKVDAADAAYFESQIKPILKNDRVEFVGEIDDRTKGDFLGNARALLFPIDWPEPFGLVMIEALACGTPVIAWNRGSVPEVIEHGVNGFIVETEEEALEAIERVDQLDRYTVRATFEKRFDSRMMALAYSDAYMRVLKTSRALVPVVSSRTVNGID